MKAASSQKKPSGDIPLGVEMDGINTIDWYKGIAQPVVIESRDAASGMYRGQILGFEDGAGSWYKHQLRPRKRSTLTMQRDWPVGARARRVSRATPARWHCRGRTHGGNHRGRARHARRPRVVPRSHCGALAWVSHALRH